MFTVLIGIFWAQQVIAEELPTPVASESYSSTDGYKLKVEFAPGFPATDAHRAIAQRWVNFLGKLTHGSELRNLTLYLQAPGETGSSDFAYHANEQRLILAPDSRFCGESDCSDATKAVVADEYGHHLSNSRRNDPWQANKWGPKYWASYEHICTGVRKGLYHPETVNGPGVDPDPLPDENWANAYSFYHYPHQIWTWNPALKPDAGALKAIKRDVKTPWSSPRTQRFTGSLNAEQSTQNFKIPLKLDGQIDINFASPTESKFTLQLYRDDKRIGVIATPTDRLKVEVCRPSKVTTVMLLLRVNRQAGSGEFNLSTSYPG